MNPRRLVLKNRLMPNPESSKRVMHPSRWGNPNKCEDARRELGGFNLISCPQDGHGCHASFLLEIANKEAQ